MLVKISEKLAILNKKRPFSQNTLISLRENQNLEWTYNSNAIEGNTLSLKETKVVLEGITMGGKTVIEHLEVINHNEAICFLEELVKNRSIVSQRNINDLHLLVLKGIDTQTQENIGKTMS
ncbi:MAG: hypothetical protein LBV51_03665 [Acholeplasmatales bacterium]|nr:hypothetical protein [Acholeplasmatales bacterium]